MPGGWEESRDKVNQDIAVLSTKMTNVEGTLKDTLNELKVIVRDLTSTMVKVAVMCAVFAVFGSAIASAVVVMAFKAFAK